jgi:hypothetical protein
MNSPQVALIDQTNGGVVSLAELQQYAAALQQQVDNDLAPAWNVRANISTPVAGDAIPPGTWPIRIVDSLSGAGGVHLDDQGQPYAEVVNDDRLSITISHELLEMLVDPSGTRLMQAPDLDPDSDQHQVGYLVEVCDPCEVYSYPIDGVPVSDFILPSFYEPNAVGPVDFLGILAGPLPQELPQGCYISWYDSEDQSWWEQLPNGMVVQGTETSARQTRAERDCVFLPADPDRHNIPAIYQAWPQAVKCVPRPM